MANEIVLYGVGDIGPDREDPVTIFEHVSGVFNEGDIVFCQLESVLSDKVYSPLPQARLACQGTPKIACALKDTGFDVVSFASNHCMDLGNEAFFETIDYLKKENLSVIGAGKNIIEARKPAIIDCKGTKVAFLAYNTILPQNYWAEADRPGCAPMRGLTLYEQIEHDQPGTPCRIHTFPHEVDLKAMVGDIKKAKAQADIVVASYHWGIHFIPAVLAQYQRDVARIAFEAGADLILGHHPHILKGIEVISGKVVFYSLSNFAMELKPTKEMLERERHKEIAALNPDWKYDPEYPTYYMPRDSRKTIVVKCIIANKKIKSVSYLPAYINKKSQPEILNTADSRFKEVVDYIETISRDQGLETQFSVVGNEVFLG